MINDKLSKIIREGKVSHAYIIEGDSLSGKEEFALDFARAILCQEAPGIGCRKCRTCRMIDAGTYRDLHKVEADERSVKQGQIEELQDRLSKNPVEPGGRNIAIISDSDTMTSRAQNRLLKDLEEPYPGTVIMLLAENSENLLKTIRSRCQTIRLYSSENRELTPEILKQKEIARAVMGMMGKGEYFYKIKNEISQIKDKKSALVFLDSMEDEYRNLMIEKVNQDKSTIRESKSIKLIEETREDIRYNVKEKYALSELILKLEDC